MALVKIGYSKYARDLSPEHACKFGHAWEWREVPCECGYRRDKVAVCQATGIPLPEVLPCEHPSMEERLRRQRFEAAIRAFPHMRYSDVLPEHKWRVPFPAGSQEREWFELSWLTLDCQTRLRAWWQDSGRDIMDYSASFTPSWVKDE